MVVHARLMPLVAVCALLFAVGATTTPPAHASSGPVTKTAQMTITSFNEQVAEKNGYHWVQSDTGAAYVMKQKDWNGCNSGNGNANTRTSCYKTNAAQLSGAVVCSRRPCCVPPDVGRGLPGEGAGREPPTLLDTPARYVYAPPNCTVNHIGS